MGNVEGSAVREAATQGYERLGGRIPVVYPPGSGERATEVGRLLEAGTGALRAILGVEPPGLEALLVADKDWERGPRENEHPYPRGLPYFTRSASPPALVLPETLSGAFRPRTGATYPLALWHELAHAFLLRGPLPHSPTWLRELVPQALSAAVARRSGLPLGEHLAQIEGYPGFTVRNAAGRASAEKQMAFQNRLLALGAAAVEEFGEDFLGALARALWRERGTVGGDRAEELLAGALGPGGREWLASREEF